MSPSIITYQPPEGTSLASFCAMSDFIQGKPITLFRDGSNIPRYTKVEPVADIDSSHGFSGEVALSLCGGGNISDLGNNHHVERPRRMHSITVRRRNPSAPIRDSQSSRFQEATIVSDDGVFHIPRLVNGNYGVSWDAGTYAVDVIGATFKRDGEENPITGFTAPQWSQVQVNVEGNIGGSYTDQLQREWDEDGETVEVTEGSMVAISGPERWHTDKHMDPVDYENRPLAGMVQALLADDEERCGSNV
jgi:hypothetical protein